MHSRPQCFPLTRWQWGRPALALLIGSLGQGCSSDKEGLGTARADGGADHDAAPESGVATVGNPRALPDAQSRVATDAGRDDGGNGGSPKGLEGGEGKLVGDDDAGSVVTNPTLATCGDAVRAPNEVCDDGNANEDDFCSSDCESLVVVAVPPDGPILDEDAGTRLPERTLGEGRHPVAAGEDGFAVAMIEPNDGEPRVMLQMFDELGQRTHLVEVSAGTEPMYFADPVVAALPDGAFAVAYTEFGGDGDGLGIALRRVSASGAVSSPAFANEWTSFAQYDPDILWTGTTLYVAWTDDSDVVSGPDLRFRRFSESLQPLDGEQTLADAGAPEGRVSLFEFKNAMGAAWREGTADGMEKIAVRADGKDWRTEAFLPGPATDLPSVVDLDDDHLLVAFTKGTDPFGTGVANLPMAHVALLPTAAPGDVTSVRAEGSSDPFVPYIANDQPALVRVNGQIFLTGRVKNIPADGDGAIQGDEIYRKELVWEPTGTPATIAMLDRLTPSEAIVDGPYREADQRRPAAVLSPFNDGAILTAWDTHAFPDGVVHAQPDVLLMLQPRPLALGDGG